MTELYELRVYNKAYGFRGWLGGPNRLTVTPRHNVLSTASVEIDAGHPRAADMVAPGARLVILREGEHLLSGPVRLTGIGDLAQGGTLTFSVEDDFRILHTTLGFPVPVHTVGGDGTINGQTVEYRTITGPAETVLKTLVAENMARLGRTDVTCAPSLGRGASGTYTIRMHPLYDRLFPGVEQAGLGVTVRQNGTTGLVVDVYEPKTFPHTLSVENGTIIDGSATTSAPTATRVIVGGQGEGTARTFKQYKDASREAEWGDIIETLQDARDSSSGDVYAERAAEVLAEGAPLSGFSLKLSETEHFRYGGAGVHVGDKVAVKIGTLEVTDVLREAVLTWTPDGGDDVEPVIGERSDDPNKLLAKQLRRLSAGDRDRKAH